jgi:DNA-binding MarR family transcriptional regulator
MTGELSTGDWQLLAQFSQVFRTVADSFTDQAGMHRAQAILTCTLAKQDGMTQSEIAEQLSIQGATVTNMLQRMEEAGLVVRRRDAEDNRLVRVYLTDEGRRKEQELNKQFQDLENAIFHGVSQEDRNRLRGLLVQLLQNMNTIS